MGPGKINVGQNLCNLSYLLGEDKIIKKPCSFQLSTQINVFFFTQLETLHLQGLCSSVVFQGLNVAGIEINRIHCYKNDFLGHPV